MHFDDGALIDLAAAIVSIARRDAQRGNAEARAWIAPLQRTRPRSLRLAAGEDDEPVRLQPAGRRNATKRNT